MAAISPSDISGRIAVVTRFSLLGDEREFQRLFAIHEGYMRSQTGFLDCYLLRSAAHPQQFDHVGWWESFPVYQRICDTPEYKDQLSGLLAHIEVTDVDVCVPAASADPAGASP